WNGDDRALREPLLEFVVFRLTLSYANPPTVIVNDDVDVIRVVEGRRAAIEGGAIEPPLGRSELPDQLRKLTSVFFVAGTAALSGEIELVPPLVLGRRRQRESAGFLVTDQVTAHRDHGVAALRPKRCEDVGVACSPIEAGEDRLLDLECVEKFLE